jgi:hypothetical protein
MRYLPVLGVALLTGCATTLMSPVPITRTATFATPADATYQHAVQAFAKMGGQVQTLDARQRLISGVVHRAVTLNVLVDAHSTVQVTGHLLPGKLVVGTMTEPQDYLNLLTQELAHAHP